jgi:hypothetical protein
MYECNHNKNHKEAQEALFFYTPREKYIRIKWDDEGREGDTNRNNKIEQ